MSAKQQKAICCMYCQYPGMELENWDAVTCSTLAQDLVYVSGSSKIQTRCHTTQFLLKLRFTAMERPTG